VNIYIYIYQNIYGIEKKNFLNEIVLKY